ncbi:MAG: 16S rRNA (guanine(966)-N(2))-methyltransferase RsmD [Halomonas sp.]|nr:16S rRNA (guanine(966)-N(2))-methyltransferase RsmD [Halomonas sp.]MCC5881238.1 16S rRNA (guanine(966)-N(2))-methyltransferase RsmD [Halomonas sp.]
MTRRRPSSRSRPDNHSSKGNGRLRIIGGEFRRRLLPVLDRPGLRPTPDRVRETLFNWLAAATPGARVLDLFAGTGALGLEALSRGATEALFVERDPQVALALGNNLQTLGAGDRGTVHSGDALALVANAPTDTPPFSLVFVDPPFRQDLAGLCCERLEQGWLTEDAWIYLETETGLEVDIPKRWSLHREVRAGDSTGRLYRRQVSLGA